MPPLLRNGRVTDVALRNAKPGEKPYKIACGGSLYLEVMPNGSKLWRWKYRMDGKENRLAIGSYPEISFKDATNQRDEARKTVKAGTHPSHEKKLDRIRAGITRADTFEILAREWVSLKDWEDDTKGRRLQTLENHVFPHIGKLPVRSITSAHVLSILQTVAKTAPTVAAEIRRSISGVYENAVATLRAESDPVYPIRKALPRHKTQHKRPLTAEEIGALLRDVEQHGGNFATKAAFSLMWMTLVRPNEAVEAEWSEFDLENGVWRIQAERMKRRQPHHTPLPRQAVTLLKTIQGITGRHTHVFPNRDDHDRPMTLQALRQIIYKTSWKGKYSPHATRATGSTRLNEMGFNKDWIEQQLAHGDTDPARASYNFAQYMEWRRGMMQQWANYLESIISAG